MDIHKLVVGDLGTNCYIVVSEKNNAFIIDPGDEADKIKKFLKAKKIAARFIVNTHGHIDHIKANASLGLPVYVSEDDRLMIADPAKNHMTVFFGSFEPVVPARLLKEGDTIELDELEFKVIHTPGHTPGGLCLLQGEVLFSGDTLFYHGIGRTDLPGSSDSAMSESLKKLSKLDGKTVCYPGHGPETTIGREFK
jgi:glyoxylase-like metal-dependent hydrolase (beta-lactamase superfamily II)